VTNWSHWTLQSSAGLWPEPTGMDDFDDGGGGGYYFKILITDSQAGQLIGRKGHGKSVIETTTGAHIRISPHGTEERTVVMKGARDSVVACATAVLYAIFGGDADCEHALDFLVPDEVCGQIYGRGGHRIKQMQVDSGCTLNETGTGVPAAERVFQAVGSLDGLVHVCCLVIDGVMGNHESLAPVPSRSKSGAAAKTWGACTCENCSYRPQKPRTICHFKTHCMKATCPYAHAR
jgi:hypothetical protein